MLRRGGRGHKCGSDGAEATACGAPVEPPPRPASHRAVPSTTRTGWRPAGCEGERQFSGADRVGVSPQNDWPDVRAHARVRVTPPYVRARSPGPRCDESRAGARGCNLGHGCRNQWTGWTEWTCWPGQASSEPRHIQGVHFVHGDHLLRAARRAAEVMLRFSEGNDHESTQRNAKNFLRSLRPFAAKNFFPRLTADCSLAQARGRGGRPAGCTGCPAVAPLAAFSGEDVTTEVVVHPVRQIETI